MSSEVVASARAEALALLENDNVVLDSAGVADLKAGRIDPRVVAVLTQLSQEHEITVSGMRSDHSKFTSGGSISNHHYGRGVDIAAVDGVPVNASNFDARQIAMELQELDPEIRPDEIGTPWAIAGPGYFTDSGHQHHLHIGFKKENAPGAETLLAPSAYPGEARELLGGSAPKPPAAAPEVPVSSGPVDPGQFGAEGAGGDPSPEALALLDNDNVVLDSTGVADLKAGRIDPRIVAVLTKLSHEHKITVSCMCSDHSKFTSGGSISNHHYGRGLDIAAVDGVPVNASNFDAREIAMELQEYDPEIRPDEIGTPWAIAGTGYFTDSGHVGHLHIGFKQQITPDWKPPGGLAAAVEAPRRAGDSIAFAAVSSRDDGAAPVPEVPAPVPSGRGAGTKAQVALAEAKKYLGTAYEWGGSTPETNFDCSGLVQWSYAQAGIQIPRLTSDQIAAENRTEVGRDALLPGDLVFFADASGDVHHVGMSLGGDKFIHAPHTGDIVKISSLDEPDYARQFTGGRRFDAAGTGPTPEPTDVAKAQARVARDAAEVRRGDSLLFAAVKAQEAAKKRATAQFLEAVPSKGGAAPPELAARPGGHPGDDAPTRALARWLAGEAERAGLPPELPVMAALVESGVKNLNYGELQAKWFIDNALAVKRKRIAAGDVDFGRDPSRWGEWIADVELPAEQFRGRYQLRLDEARGLLG